VCNKNVTEMEDAKKAGGRSDGDMSTPGLSRRDRSNLTWGNYQYRKRQMLALTRPGGKWGEKEPAGTKGRDEGSSSVRNKSRLCPVLVADSPRTTKPIKETKKEPGQGDGFASVEFLVLGRPNERLGGDTREERKKVIYPGRDLVIQDLGQPLG